MSKRPAYRVCPRCGAHLDSCEICDCAKAWFPDGTVPTDCAQIVNRPVMGLKNGGAS